MKKLIGPVDVSRRWTVEGITYEAVNGVVTPTPPPGHVDSGIYALGFYWKDDGASGEKMDKLDKATDLKK